MVIPRRGRPPPSPLGCICLHPGPVVYHSSSTSRSPPPPQYGSSPFQQRLAGRPHRRRGRVAAGGNGSGKRRSLAPRFQANKVAALERKPATERQSLAGGARGERERKKGKGGRCGFALGRGLEPSSPQPSSRSRARETRGETSLWTTSLTFFLPCHAVQQKWRFERGPEVVPPLERVCGVVESGG